MKETLPIKSKELDFNEYGINMSKLLEIAKPRSENAIRLSKERKLGQLRKYNLAKLEFMVELRLIKKAISNWPKFKSDYVYKSKDWIKVTKRKWKIN